MEKDEIQMQSIDDKINEIHLMITIASQDHSADAAMRWTQAANNAANALSTLQAIKNR
tara:strand:+ start:40765 stop:40938 length:174 start_codon:yes stop_codon:yes gene_type:complete